jgi:hypothetical protein
MVRNPRRFLGTMARLENAAIQLPDAGRYKSTEAAWLSPDATTLGINFATAFAQGNLPVTSTRHGRPGAGPQQFVAVVTEMK